MINYDVIILGGGPAGCSAGIYLGRANIKTLIIKDENNGSLNKAHLIDNYAGFEKIAGIDLNQKMINQAQNLGCDIINGKIIDVDFSQNDRIIKTSVGNFKAKYIVIAIGSESHVKIDGETKFTGMGVSYCATCDGAFTKNRKVILAGNGDEVLEEALFLTRFTKDIVILCPDKDFICNNENAALINSKNIKIVKNINIKEIIGTDVVKKIVCEKDGYNSEFLCDFLFLYLGTKTNAELFNVYLDIDKFGYIRTDENMMTKISNIYAIGDIRQKEIRQVATAVADGCICGIAITKDYIKNKK